MCWKSVPAAGVPGGFRTATQFRPKTTIRNDSPKSLRAAILQLSALSRKSAHRESRMFDNYFDGKRVLVTGVSGVKGTWLALMLLHAGAIVIGLDKRIAGLRSNFTATGLGGRIRFVHGDIRDLALMRRLVDEVDCLFHLAAEAIVGETVRNPYEAYSSNTFGTATVLEAVRLAAAPKRC